LFAFQAFSEIFRGQNTIPGVCEEIASTASLTMSVASATDGTTQILVAGDTDIVTASALAMALTVVIGYLVRTAI